MKWMACMKVRDVLPISLAGLVMTCRIVDGMETPVRIVQVVLPDTLQSGAVYSLSTEIEADPHATLVVWAGRCGSEQRFNDNPRSVDLVAPAQGSDSVCVRAYSGNGTADSISLVRPVR